MNFLLPAACACLLLTALSPNSTADALERSYQSAYQSSQSTVEAITINRSQGNRGEENGNGFYQLRLFSDGASAGSYYGSGQGNKALLGLSNYHKRPVAEFFRLSFDALVPESSPTNRMVYLNFIVDLNCDELDPQYGIIVVDSVTRNKGPQGQWNHYSIRYDEAIFRSVGGIGGLPGHLEAESLPLSALTESYPSACFVNTDPFDNGMKKHTTYPSFLMVLGDSNTTSPSHIRIDNVLAEVGASSDLYDMD